VIRIRPENSLLTSRVLLLQKTSADSFFLQGVGHAAMPLSAQRTGVQRRLPEGARSATGSVRPLQHLVGRRPSAFSPTEFVVTDR